MIHTRPSAFLLVQAGRSLFTLLPMPQGARPANCFGAPQSRRPANHLSGAGEQGRKEQSLYFEEASLAIPLLLLLANLKLSKFSLEFLSKIRPKDRHRDTSLPLWAARVGCNFSPGPQSIIIASGSARSSARARPSCHSAEQTHARTLAPASRARVGPRRGPHEAMSARWAWPRDSSGRRRRCAAGPQIWPPLPARSLARS